jgi:hypothetical protein
MRRQSDSLSGASFIKQCFASVAEDMHGLDSGVGAVVLFQAVRDKKINLIVSVAPTPPCERRRRGDDQAFQEGGPDVWFAA